MCIVDFGEHYFLNLLLLEIRSRSAMWLAVAVICLIQQSTNSEGFGTYLNPQVLMTTPEILQSWGYPSEQYDILTDDGYFLKLDRIPFGVNSHGKKGNNSPVLLVSGLNTDTRCWVANPPSNSLGFALADAGYDVWMLNVRGNNWSRRHQNLSIEQEEFWNFSFHEMGIYDIPATVKFILKETKHHTLYYIGHSQGATLGLIAFTIMPQLAQNVSLLMLFAPTYTIVNMTSITVLLKLLPHGLERFILGNKEYRTVSNEIKALNAKLCSTAIMDKLCAKIISAFFGNNEKNLNMSRLDVYAGMFPDSTSAKTMIHWIQVARTQEFKYFDYNSKNKALYNMVGKTQEFKYFDYSCKNKAVYNMTTPPFYELEDLTVPTALWSGGNDIIEHIRDIERLLPRLTHLIFYKHLPDWNHADYVLGLDAPKCLYPDIFSLMEQYK